MPGFRKEERNGERQGMLKIAKGDGNIKQANKKQSTERANCSASPEGKRQFGLDVNSRISALQPKMKFLKERSVYVCSITLSFLRYLTGPESVIGLDFK